jgi:hypothetical protein
MIIAPQIKAVKRRKSSIQREWGSVFSELSLDVCIWLDPEIDYYGYELQLPDINIDKKPALHSFDLKKLTYVN